MCAVYIEPIKLDQIDGIFPESLTSTFWQTCEDPVDGHPTPDNRLDKEAWLNAVTLSWGLCGYSLRATDSPLPLATLLFAPPSFTPRARFIPTGPVSADSILLASLHFAPRTVTQSHQLALIDVALSHLTTRGVKAVEAFGCSGPIDTVSEPIELVDSTLSDVVASNPTGREDSVYCDKPHECTADKVRDICHASGDLINTKVLIDAGFTVVKPHPTHPKLRKDLTPDLNWNEAVGEALDRRAATGGLRGKSDYEFFSAARS